MRLHPVKDGLIPMPDERGMTVRDRAGNRLVDVVDPDSGYCVGVRSPLTIKAKVMEAAPVSGGSGADVRFDPDSARFYELVRNSPNEPIGFVVRLESDGDEALPCSRVRIIQSTVSIGDESARNSTAPVRKAKSVRQENDEAARAVMSALGYTGRMTPEIRDAALTLIALEKNLTGKLHLSPKKERALRAKIAKYVQGA